MVFLNTTAGRVFGTNCMPGTPNTRMPQFTRKIAGAVFGTNEPRFFSKALPGIGTGAPNLRRTCEILFSEGMKSFQASKGLIYLMKSGKEEIEAIWEGHKKDLECNWGPPKSSSYSKGKELSTLESNDVLRLSIEQALNNQTHEKHNEGIIVSDSSDDKRIYKAAELEESKSIVFIPINTTEGVVCFKFERARSNPFTPENSRAKIEWFQQKFINIQEMSKTEKEIPLLFLVVNEIGIFYPDIICNWGPQVIKEIIGNEKLAKSLATRGIAVLDIFIGDVLSSNRNPQNSPRLEIFIPKPPRTIDGPKREEYYSANLGDWLKQAIDDFLNPKTAS